MRYLTATFSIFSFKVSSSESSIRVFIQGGSKEDRVEVGLRGPQSRLGVKSEDYFTSFTHHPGEAKEIMSWQVEKHLPSPLFSWKKAGALCKHSARHRFLGAILIFINCVDVLCHMCIMCIIMCIVYVHTNKCCYQYDHYKNYNNNNNYNNDDNDNLENLHNNIYYYYHHLYYHQVYYH